MYSTLEVSKLTGASKRRLQYWDEQKLIVPKKLHAKARQYTRGQVKEIAFALRARKYTNLKTIRELLVLIRAKTISPNSVLSALKVIDSIGITL